MAAPPRNAALPPRNLGKTAQGNRAQRGNPQTRRTIMKAAQSLLDHSNIADVTVDDIVREAGVARGTFYIYFKDKLDVLVALARNLNEELFEASHLSLDRGASAYERIRLSLRRVVDNWIEHNGIFRSLTQMAMTRPDFLELSQELRFPFIIQIRQDLESSMAGGRAKPIDAAVAAKALAAMMDWFCLLWFGLNEPPYEGAGENIDEVVDHLSLLWYRALYGADPAI
jgi:AcrR family transcriptional regulator